MLRKDFHKLSKLKQHSVLVFQRLSQFGREDFELLNDDNQVLALAHQDLSWLEREDFHKLSEKNKKYAVLHQKLTWITRKDFEELSDKNKDYAIQLQNLTWLKKKDFEKLSEYQKVWTLTFQSLPWFTKKVCGPFYSMHKKRTKKQRFNEMTEYAAEFNLVFDGENLFAFRNHNELGLGEFKLNAFYDAGKYYRDWHVNHNAKSKNSFGLGIFPEGNTPVRVHIDDWGCRVKDSNKCRVWGFTVESLETYRKRRGGENDL